MAIRKLCASAGCDELAIEGLAHCDAHEARRQEKLRRRKASAQLTPEAALNRKLYADVAWRSARKRFLKAHPLCADCEDLGVFVEAVEVDHIKPHKGDRKLFWDRSNWQASCKSCHSRKTAREVWHGG